MSSSVRQVWGDLVEYDNTNTSNMDDITDNIINSSQEGEIEDSDIHEANNISENAEDIDHNKVYGIGDILLHDFKMNEPDQKKQAQHCANIFKNTTDEIK